MRKERSKGVPDSESSIVDRRTLRAKRISDFVPIDRGAPGWHVIEYLRNLEARGYSRHTLRSRTAHLRYFLIWLQEFGIRNLLDFSPQTLEEYSLQVLRHGVDAGRPLSAHSTTAMLCATLRWMTFAFFALKLQWNLRHLRAICDVAMSSVSICVICGCDGMDDPAFSIQHLSSRGFAIPLWCCWEARVTTPDQLRDIVRYLQNRVTLVAEGEKTIAFNPPTAGEMAVAGLDETTATRLTSAPWWQEMVDDIIETPDFAEPDATPTVVLGYARDVIQEYIGKRLPLDS